MINRVIQVGRLVKDPESRKTQNGDLVVNFTIAVNDRFSDNVNFFDCVVWRQSAEYVSKFVRKGDLVGVDGRLQQRSWTNKDGVKQYTTEIVAEQVQNYQPRSTEQPTQEKAQPEVVQDDNLPF